jgi:CheY-like chemotaxis protein
MTSRLNHILLIDDSDDDNEFHEIVLHDGDFAQHVTTVTSAEKALAFFSANKHQLPELIFLDAMMPRINGFELIQKFKQIIEAERITSLPKIILLSGIYYPSLEDITTNADYKNLVAGYRIKPLTRNMVTEILQTNF